MTDGFKYRAGLAGDAIALHKLVRDAENVITFNLQQYLVQALYFML